MVTSYGFIVIAQAQMGRTPASPPLPFTLLVYTNTEKGGGGQNSCFDKFPFSLLLSTYANVGLIGFPSTEVPSENSIKLNSTHVILVVILFPVILKITKQKS